VLLNLAGNAIKFTETGGVGVIVEAGPNVGEVVFKVHDSGIGIAPGQQARIFHEFEQADGGSARKFGGTGLGLAISQRIVERMGGRIEVESTPGVGSTFRAILPLPPAEDADGTRVARPDLSGLAVLIVAPATVEASLIERKLNRWGASAMHLAPHLTDMFAQRHWDVVLVDHSIVAEAATPAGSMAQARRIVLIAPAERHRLPALKEAGFAGYLVKPIRAASLKAQLIAAPHFDGVAATEASTPAAAAEIDSARRPLHVLVAEDNEINALLTRTLLTRLGHVPVMAESGSVALERWRDAREKGAPYDLVLMDMHMPGVDGLEAARRIRAAEAERNDRPTPIIALTANAFAEDREACLAAGMDGFLVKPLERDRLAAALDALPDTAALAA
jgi:CheY-like chemotaxis protein